MQEHAGGFVVLEMEDRLEVRIYCDREIVTDRAAHNESNRTRAFASRRFAAFVPERRRKFGHPARWFRE